MNRIFLLCNAHLDPVWQWDVEEGLAAAVSTFRSAADFCEENEGFIFNHNEALLYRAVEEAEPALFARIQRLVKEGKWHIMGGFELQPDCVMPQGESYIRQILRGQSYFGEKFGVRPTVAVNVDSFGHSRGLVQILKKCGYEGYVFMRPEAFKVELPDNFRWVVFDGSELVTHRFTTCYNSLLGDNAKELLSWVEAKHPQGDSLYPWGVGDHGGGPSRKDLADIAKLQADQEPAGYTLIHSTPEAYFAVLDSEALPTVDHSLYPSQVGCYTSMTDIKQHHRRLENALFVAEKMASAAFLQEGIAYPAKEIDDAYENLAFVQFHDSLPGTMIETAKHSMLNKAGMGLELAARVRRRAFFALSRRIGPGEAGTIPVLVYNPHPYPISQTVTCEYMLENQNWDKNTVTVAEVTLNGKIIPSQMEKEESCLPLDWRKRVVFQAELAPMTMHRFDCRLTVLQQSNLSAKENVFRFDNGTIVVQIDPMTGMIADFRYQDRPIATDRFGEITVFADDFDPWHMRGDTIGGIVGQFVLLEGEALQEFLGVKEPVAPVRMIEDGEVRTVIEADFVYGNSFAVVRYLIPKAGSAVEMEIQIICNEREKMFRLALPVVLENPTVYSETMFGVEPAYMDGRESVSQRFDLIKGKEGLRLAVLNDCVYGGSFVDGVWYKNLLRTSSYCAHPIDDRQVLPSDRYLPRMECGRSSFRFRLIAGDEALTEYEAALQAQIMNEPAMAVSFFPCGDNRAQYLSPEAAVRVDGRVLVSVIGQPGRSESEKALTLRLYEPEGKSGSFSVEVPAFGVSFKGDISPCEIKTYRICPSSMKETAISDCD